MLFYNRFRFLLPDKFPVDRDNSSIKYLVQTIYSHTIDSLQKPTETLPQFIDNYLSPVNVDKREKASKRLREIVEPTSTDKNELGVLDCLEAFRRSAESFIRAYSTGNETLVAEEYEKFLSHFRLLFCKLRYCFLLPTWKHLHPDALNSFELFGGVYLLLDILLLDYYLNIQRSGSVSISCKPEVVLAVRKYTFYFLFDAYYTRHHLKSENVLSIQQLLSKNRRLMSIFLAMLNPNPADHFTNLYVNQYIIWLFRDLSDNSESGRRIDLRRLPRLRDCGGFGALMNFCQTIQDESMFMDAFDIFRELSDVHRQALYQNVDSSFDLLLSSLTIPSDLRPENNRARILFRRFCERVLPRRIFCALRTIYYEASYYFWDHLSLALHYLISDSVTFHLNSDSGWKSRISRISLSFTHYFHSHESSTKLILALGMLETITHDVHRHPAAFERLRQEDICAKLVDILSLERTDLMMKSCRLMYLLTLRPHAAPERRRLKELGAVEKLEYLAKYSSEGELINEFARKASTNLQDFSS